LYASGLGVVRDLLGSTIASECDSHARAGRLPREGTVSVLTPLPFVFCSLDAIRICITQKHSNTSAMVVGRPLVGLMRSTSVPGSLLYTRPSAPISPLSALTFPPLLSHFALGRFRTIPSDTVSCVELKSPAWDADEKSSVLISSRCL
jgi:hypothetical protein